MLIKHADDGDGLPFEVVDAASATPWESCVPLVSLRTYVSASPKQQSLLDGAWGMDLIRWDGHPAFSEGMFVAKIQGDAMEPAIPSGSYCLFGPESNGDREGKVLFVTSPGLNDPHAGGSWTVRRFESMERKDESEEWTFDRIVLRPDNAEYPAFTLDLKDQDELKVLGELVEVLVMAESPEEASTAVETEV